MKHKSNISTKKIPALTVSDLEKAFMIVVTITQTKKKVKKKKEEAQPDQH